VRDSGEVSATTSLKAVWSEVARVAKRQFGVISLEQLLACGLSYAQVRHAVEQGHLHRLHRGVYAVGHTRLVDHAYLIAALLAMGDDSFLSHRTSAAVRGLRPIAVRAIEVTVRTRARRKGLTVHRTGYVHPDDITTRNGLRVSSVARMLIELAPRESERELTRLITQAARKRILEIEKVEEAMARHQRRPGLSKLKRALAAYRPREDRKSDLEIAFDELLDRHPDIPPPKCNIVIDGWEIDCYWPDSKVAVELDGRPYHIAVRDIEKDRFKDAKLLTMGIKPLRITDSRFELDPLGALQDLRALLQLA
jgi:Transcriptional regulator, AbiEi antitoxin